MAPLSFPQPRTCLVAAAAFLVATTIVAATPAAPAPHGDACSRSFDLDGDRLYLPANKRATVDGTHHWPQGTNATLVLGFPDGQPPEVLRNESVAVDDGLWTATVDLSAVEEGRTFVARVERDGRVVDAVAGEVGTPEASVTFENQTVSPTGRVVVRRVHLDLGGFVAIHAEEPSGPIVGYSRHLAPGTHENVTIHLDESLAGPSTLVAMPHLDSDCDEKFGFFYGPYSDGPYLEDATQNRAVTDAATVQFPTPTPSPSPSPSPTPTATPTATVTPSPMPSETPTSTPRTTPGLGWLAAIVGGTVAVLLRWTLG